MTLKTILLPLIGAAGWQGPLEVSLALGRHFGATVEALHVAEGWHGMSKAAQTVMASAMRETETSKAAARKRFDEACARLGVAVADTPASIPGFAIHFSVIAGHKADVVATRGRLADLIITACPEAGEESAGSETLEAVVMGSGRPMLAVPPGTTSILGGTVAICWNGRPEAARSLLFALPFLREAASVVVLEVDEAGRRRGVDAEQVVQYLARHGVEASGEAIERRDKSVGEALLGGAGAAGADLAVMGGNAHNRLRQFIFGGVSRDVLMGTRIPVLIAN